MDPPPPDFSFAPAAAMPAPAWPTDEVAAAETAAVAAAAAAGPSQAEVEEELLARFKDQLEAVMEESLGPLLASGGALDPEMARKIARETSACPALRLGLNARCAALARVAIACVAAVCAVALSHTRAPSVLARFKDEIARLSASGALSPPPSAHDGSERGAGSLRDDSSLRGDDDDGGDDDEEGSDEYTSGSDEDEYDSDEYTDEDEDEEDDPEAALDTSQDYDEAAAYAAYAAAAAAAGYATTAGGPAGFTAIGRAPLAYRGPDAAAELAAAVAAAVEAGELDPYAAADAAVDATVMLRRAAPTVTAVDPDAETNNAAAEASARLAESASRAAEAEAVAAASRERARRAFERLGLPIAPSLRRPEEVEALRKASDAMLDEADAAGHGVRVSRRPQRVYTLPSAAAAIEGDDEASAEPSTPKGEVSPAAAKEEEGVEEAQLRQLRRSSTKATHAAVTSAAAAAAAAVAAARTRAAANVGAAAAAATGAVIDGQASVEATVRAKARPVVPYMAVRSVKPGGAMLPPEEPERTRHVDRRSLLEEDVAPVAAQMRAKAEVEEEEEALTTKPPTSPRGTATWGW